ncbi:hypothetical protein ABZ783_28875 [Micromonospora sp. NPDC047738]|uniref:hypothetical protein n=1 Tax=Micromonospora sp. NPDC047738 TaxID=3155741 RepID=UPI0034011500
MFQYRSSSARSSVRRRAEVANGGNGEQLRDSPDTAEALSALFTEKINVIDARMAELAALRDDLAARIGTGCPLRAAGQAGP